MVRAEGEKRVFFMLDDDDDDLGFVRREFFYVG